MKSKPTKRKSIEPYAFVTIGLIACSSLMYEILLTRVCALRLMFHFSYLVVSNCLLAIGASGSMIFIFQDAWKKRERSWIWTFGLLYVVSLILVYGFLLNYPLGDRISFRDPGDLLAFTFFNLVAAVPFFFSGCVIGMILTFNPDHVNKVYFCDLIGAGLGCLMCPLLLLKTGAGGCLIFLTLLAVGGITLATPSAHRSLALVAGTIIGLVGFVLLPRIDRRFPVPSKEQIKVTKRLGIDISENMVLSKWSAISRVDLVDMEPATHFLFGRGRKAIDLPVPEAKYIVQDGSAGTAIMNFSENPEGLTLLARSTYSAAVKLKENPRVFIIGVGGGNDVWAAKIHDPEYVKGVELNEQIIAIHREVLPRFSRGIVEDPRIDLVYGEGRSVLMRENDEYDVIQMTGADTWTALASGAYVLAENYLYTVEAFESMYDRLAEGGIVQVTRYALDMETLRLLSNIYQAFKTRGEGKFENSVICLRTPPLVTVLSKRDEFTALELNRLIQFAEEEEIDIIYSPNRSTGNIVEEFVRCEDKHRFIHEFPRDISPTPDDRPYFFNYTKWTNLFLAAKHFKETPMVSQGNPLFILGQLGVSAILAAALILFPLLALRRKGVKRAHRTRFLIYFLGAGFGFIGIEIVMIQKLVLFLGHPLYSIAVTLSAILIFTSLGSLLSERWFHSPTQRAWLVPVALAVLLGTFVILSPWMVRALIGLSTVVRILVAIGILAPVGLVLGVPFAFGIRLLNRFNPTIIPWAWAVNACATVVGAIVAVVLSINFGFTFVLVAAVLTYFEMMFSIRTLLR